MSWLRRSRAIKLPKLTVKQWLGVAILIAASIIAHWHLSSLGEGDVMQTAEDALALLLFW